MDWDTLKTMFATDPILAIAMMVTAYEGGCYKRPEWLPEVPKESVQRKASYFNRGTPWVNLAGLEACLKLVGSYNEFTPDRIVRGFKKLEERYPACEWAYSLTVEGSHAIYVTWHNYPKERPDAKDIEIIRGWMESTTGADEADTEGYTSHPLFRFWWD